MREILQPVDSVKLETELGAIYASPRGGRSLLVHAPHLTVDGVPLQFSATMTSADSVNWDFIWFIDTQTGKTGIASQTITARLVDGRDADLITLGKIAQVVIPAVRNLARTNPKLFLEAERRHLNNEIIGFEREIESKRTKIEEREQRLTEIEARLRA